MVGRKTKWLQSLDHHQSRSDMINVVYRTNPQRPDVKNQHVVRHRHHLSYLLHEHSSRLCWLDATMYYFREFSSTRCSAIFEAHECDQKTEEDTTIINEKNLIANRLLLKNILMDDSMSICPKHRGSFGIDWRDHKSACHFPNSDQKYHATTSDCRRATLKLCSKIEGFPIGGRLLFCFIPIKYPSLIIFFNLDCVRSTEKWCRYR